MTETKSTMTFPHPTLTPIVGTPNNFSIQKLQKQLYANAISVHSTRGGGDNGHLAILMSPATYLARTAVAFIAPIHPGHAPVHDDDATGFQITEINRRWKQTLIEFERYKATKTSLTQQLLAAVENDFLAILENPDFGYTDISPGVMLSHLKEHYGTISSDDIETNRNKLFTPINVDKPLETIWLRIKEVQCFALAANANEPISDDAVVRITLPMFEKTGVFDIVTEKWRDKPDIEWTMPLFKAHFDKGNKERIHKLTAKTAGYHGANAATTPPTLCEEVAAAATTPTSNEPPSIRTNNLTMYYCWSHGLGKNRAHTSATCQHKKDGHKDDATADKLMGGNNRIMSGFTRPAAPGTSNA